MQVGVFDQACWQMAGAPASAHETIALPSFPAPPAGEHVMQASSAYSERCLGVLRDRPVNFLIDDDGKGAHFVIEGRKGNDVRVRMLHEYLGVPLVSHFVDPVWSCMPHLPRPLFYRALMNDSWIKLIFDQAHAYELQQYGVPQVYHLPMAARDMPYETGPLPEPSGAPISFMGAQHNSYFFPQNRHAGPSLFPGILAMSYRMDAPETIFYDIYHEVYGLAPAPKPTQSPEERTAAMERFFEARFHYASMLWMAQRDRFVIFLKRHLGKLFEIRGARWDGAYGLECVPPPDTYEGYIRYFREKLINLNFISGNAETAPNLRCFEVTAAGGFLLCQHRPELPAYFEIGKEIDTFRDEKELLDKCKYYLDHPQRCREIAAAGQRRTLREHLYSHRLNTVCGLIETQGIRRSQVPEIPRVCSLRSPLEDCRRLAPTADVILDCGAHIGTYAYAFRQAYPSADIYAFEPVSSNYERLAQIASEISVKPVRAAVSDVDGETEIHLTRSDQSASLLPYQAKDNPLADCHAVIGRERVPVRTIDGWCRESGVDPRRVDIVKMDIQGAELKALAGASQVLKHAKAVILEVGLQSYYDGMPLFEDIDKYMNKRGFVRHALYASGEDGIWGDALYVNGTLRGAGQ